MSVLFVCFRGIVRAHADGGRRGIHARRHGYLGERQTGIELRLCGSVPAYVCTVVEHSRPVVKQRIMGTWRSAKGPDVTDFNQTLFALNKL